MQRTPDKSRLAQTEPCLLASIAAPALGGVLPGLTLKPSGEIGVAATACARCGGAGRILDHDANMTVSCDLNARLARVRALIDRYQRVHQVSALPICRETGAPPAQFAAAINRLAALAAGKTAHGLVYEAPGPADRQLSVWTIALAAAWRFGFDVEVMTLDRGNAAVHMPRVPDASTGKFLVFVEKAERLWVTKVVEDFEQIVSFAYGAVVPLWASFRPLEAPAGQDPADQAASRLNVKRELNRKLALAKAKPPLAWVAPETRSRLAEVADVAAALWPKRASKERRPGDPGSGMPRLPWNH